MRNSANVPMISLCIPTYNRPEVLNETLKSIYSQNVNDCLFEVCISDDSTDYSTYLVVQKYLEKHDNIIYKKNSERQVYKNLIESLKMGNGRILKLLNDYCMLKPNSLSEIITFVSNQDEKSWISFLKHTENIEFDNLDGLINFGDYHLTWCSSFAIWKEDFDKIILSKSVIDDFFPHFDLLLSSTNSKYIVYGDNPFLLQKANNQGGYNLPKEFVVRLLRLIKNCDNNITKKTIIQIKFKIVEFVVKRYRIEYNNGFTNDYNGCLKSIYEELGIVYLIYYFYKKLFAFRRKK